MRKGCKLYAILVLNEKGDAETLEYFPLVSDLFGVFPQEISGLPPNKESKFNIDMKPGR